MEERGSISRWLFIGLAVAMLFYFGQSWLGGGSAPSTQPLGKEDWGTAPEGNRPEESFCELVGSRSSFKLSSRGGALVSTSMSEPKYAQSVDKRDTRIDLITTTREQRMPLRTSLRVYGAPEKGDAEKQQVELDNLDFTLAAQDPRSCTFEFKSATTSITKVVSLTDRPFEIDVAVTVQNLSADKLTHRYAIEQSSWRTKKETESSFWDLGRRPEWLTDVTTATSTGVHRSHPTDFDPDDFKAKDGFTNEQWKRFEGDGIWAAIGSNYFAALVLHREGPTPKAEALIEDGSYYKLRSDSPDFGHMYRARLAYPETELEPQQSVTYGTTAYLGPKEREVISVVGGTDPSKTRLGDVIDLGMFAALGKIAVSYVHWLFHLVGSWGWAICLLTITVKMVVFPLQLPQLKTTVAMRRLKPEIDEINKKYEGDMMQKNLALQELHRREGIRPALGCLPLLLQMPVWFALYQSLATAVELYHEPFGPFIPDLTHSDPYHIIPIVLGASSFLQQKMMPAQGMDPAQQKMMMYMMPGIFTAMMFFLPAGLGVYMMTNTWLGILQQTLVERWVQSKLGTTSQIEVREVESPKGSKRRLDKDEGGAPALEKGKARARG